MSEPWQAASMRRVSLVGIPGSGKTTVGHRLAASMDAPLIELDSIFHQPNWEALERDDFRARVRLRSEQEIDALVGGPDLNGGVGS
jgi:adenylate kinase family enzyme